MKALNALNPIASSAARSRQLAQRDGLSFRDRLKKMAPLRVAGWRQLLRLNREAQVDSTLAPPTAPPGYTAPDAQAERAHLRRIVEQRKPEIEQDRASDGLDGRRQAVANMLTLLESQQRAHERIAARGVWAEGQR